MVDFGSKIKSKKEQLDPKPTIFYEKLDRASDKGPLRTIQTNVLNKWFDSYKDHKDVILKLHTGQGKTLIGLLILKSKLISGKGPCVYVCPNNYLVDQTIQQAEQFGIKATKCNPGFPPDFLDGSAILVTSVHKLFNGMSIFGTDGYSEDVGAIVVDDAHACIKSIRDAFTIRIESDDQLHSDFITIFGDALKHQGIGTYYEIEQKVYSSFLSVPYWEWNQKIDDVTRILSRNTEKQSIKYAWPLLRNCLKNCQCIISGNSLEIFPLMPEIEQFGSFADAKHRVFMSATFTDDSFLVKELSVAKQAIEHPLIDESERWSGEKLILVPSLIDESLNRGEVVRLFGKMKEKRYGVIALSPSFRACGDWSTYGSKILKTDTINGEIEKLKSGVFSETTVIVNRYDGIDLPDNACRILIFDSKPFSNFLQDKYIESCLPGSKIAELKVAQSIEQGIGRGVRGEKDYCCIIMIGDELVKRINSSRAREYFSAMVRRQLEIGLEVTRYAKEEGGSGKTPLQILSEVINQQLTRDASWKAFYEEKMSGIEAAPQREDVLAQLEFEKGYLSFFNKEKFVEAKALIQDYLDTHSMNDFEKGWYLQEMARVSYPISKTDSNAIQIKAHNLNRYLLKPQNGMNIKKIVTLSKRRVEKIKEWVKNHGTYSDLLLNVNEMLSSLSLGVDSEKFEDALDKLGQAIGFDSQRPDKEWGGGPDNLWLIRDNEYLFFECKNEVNKDRATINKDETSQMNNSCGWFVTNYGSVQVKYIMIISTKKVSKHTAFNYDAKIMRERKMNSLKGNVLSFFKEFHDKDFNDLDDTSIQSLLENHHLGLDYLKSEYVEDHVQLRETEA